MPSRMCRAIIFGLDGVLIDSNDLYERQWKRWAKRHRVSFFHIRRIYHGRPPRYTIRTVAPHLDNVREAQVFRDELAALKRFEGVSLFPKIPTLLDSIPSDAWAIATSAPRDFALRMINHAELRLPSVFVTIDDVTQGKPHPMPYFKAAQSLGVSIKHTVVVEDSPAGITSALEAGAYVVGVMTTNGIDELIPAHSIVRSVSDLSVVRQPDGNLKVCW